MATALEEPAAEELSGTDTDGGESDGAAETDADVDTDAGVGERRYKSLLEWTSVIFGALILAVLVKTFLLQAFWIPSESMSPTLDVGDRVIVNKLTYNLGGVSRGDLVVFAIDKKRVREEGEGTTNLVKRVIGLGGERIEAIDGVVHVDGLAMLETSYLEDDVVIGDFGAIEVPDGSVFVMGDNREGSFDSRVFGPIDEDDIVGRAIVTIWPLHNLGFL